MPHDLLSGPCSCGCHDRPNTMHIMPCCAYTYVPRHRAEAHAAKLRAEAEQKKPSLLDSIEPKEGVIPPRPPALRHLEGVSAQSNDEAVGELLQAGKVVAYGGLSLLGAEGRIVFVVGLMRVRESDLKGWYLSVGNTDNPDFRHVDTSAVQLEELPFPNTMVYFVAETDERLIEPDAPREELTAIARFILPFISDEGPPKGIDW